MRILWVLIACLALLGCSGSSPFNGQSPDNEVGKADTFNWRSGCESGDGSFAQHIAKDDVVLVGTIPAMIANVTITLKADSDVDIQLFDADGTQVVRWPDGLLNKATQESIDYKGLKITWSGFGGVDGVKGHEFIKLEGVLTNAFEMKAFGYAAGQAQVEYAWEARPGCVDRGSGSFEQEIAKDEVVTVGTIPAGKSNLRVELSSPVDVDIQLFDADGSKVVCWPDGLLSGSQESSVSYKGVKVTYSGYNGVDGDKGHEFIEIEGTIENDFIMKAFGFEAGVATVTYSWGPPQAQPSAEAIFSPKSYSDSHVAKVVELINQAQKSIDIAMYSMSDSRVNNALKDAIQNRGVAVRFIFHQAQLDAKQSTPDGTRSAKLEDVGVDVRYVTKSKIMHHKFMIVDGPPLNAYGYPDMEMAGQASLVSGSGNWSSGAQTVYDENTVFLTGVPALVLAFQQEFNMLWNQAYDFVHKPYPFQPADALDGSMWIDDDEQTDAFFTSANFKTNQAFTVRSGSYEVATRIIEELKKANQSIHIASGHFRSWPIHEALVQLKQQKPHLDIKVYLDGQEYISQSYDDSLQQELSTCLSTATTEEKKQGCYLKGNYWSYQAHQAGISVRFKYYAYRWHYNYAKQMHHKYLIVDNETLLTGSYNLSDNAERKTFENVIALRGSTFAPVIQQFIDNFNELWSTDASGAKLSSLKYKIENDNSIPLVFSPMALTWDQIADLKDLIATNCPAVFSEDYKKHPENHKTCPRAN